MLNGIKITVKRAAQIPKTATPIPAFSVSAISLRFAGKTHSYEFSRQAALYKRS